MAVVLWKSDPGQSWLSKIKGGHAVYSFRRALLRGRAFGWQTVVVGAVLTAALALVGAACGSSSPKSSGSATSGVATSGPALVVGTSADFPPTSFKDLKTGKIVGFENDMLRAVLPKMGRSFSWSQLDFNGLIPALQSGRINMVVSGLYDTTAREQVVDFVDYMKIPLAVMTLKSNLSSVTGPMGLCGHSVAYLVGSPPETTQLTQWSQQCTSAGKSGITQRGYQTVAEAVADISNGRTYAELEGDIVVLYVSKTQYGNKLGVAFDVAGGTSTIGIAVQKNSPLLAPLKTAVTDWINSPTYCSTAKTWDLTAGDLVRSC